MAAPPREAAVPAGGTKTFLFTDIEGSTRLWEAHPDQMQAALGRHDALVRQAVAAHNGVIFKSAGDAFFAAFVRASDAVAAALSAQLALGREQWPDATPIKVRMALNSGAVEQRDGDYFGTALNRAARILAAGHGGQTLLSQDASELCADALPESAWLHDLGSHQLKDLPAPERVYQLQHPDLAVRFPPIRSLSTHPHNLPHQLTSFVGRDAEIAAIESLLRQTRLLTFIGTGGTGKSRLSLQVAAAALPQFPDGAWFVELAGLADPVLVPQAVAGVLGVKEVPGETVARTLTRQVGAKQLLLILDNCEHLLDACAQLAEAVMRACANVKILASSREALGLAGERTYRVPSLSLPDHKAGTTAKAISTSESVRLFVDRALLVRADFDLTDDNAPALASLCAHLDGIPLAIELAAARMRSMTVQEIGSKLDQRFRLLTGGSRTALPRQRTLRALIDWSYDLLHGPEKVLLERLSVFAGGWTLEAAGAVCTDQQIATQDLLDLLTALCDKSLVIVEQVDSHSRYRLLETVRQYGRERLADRVDGNAVLERHGRYFLALAEVANAGLHGRGQAQWCARLEEEHENLLAGLEWFHANGGSADSLRSCAALADYWIMQGHLSEGREWFDRVLSREGNKAQTKERARALESAGALALYKGNLPAAGTWYDESLAIARQFGDRDEIARALRGLGVLRLALGDFAAARAIQEESLALSREAGDARGIAECLGELGAIALSQGDVESARPMLEDSLLHAQASGDRWNMGLILYRLGLVACFSEDLPAAWSLLQESLAIRRAFGDRGGAARALSGLAMVAYDRGDYMLSGAMYRESLVMRRVLGDDSSTAISLEGLAEVAGALGHSLLSARIWGATERLRAEIGAPLRPAWRRHCDRSIAATRAALGDDQAFDRCRQQGREWTLEQAIDYALDESF